MTTLDTLSPGFDAEPTFRSGASMAELGQEVARRPEADDYRAQATDIFATIEQFRTNREFGLRGALELARETYVDQETNPGLQEFSDVLLQAPFICRMAARSHRQKEDENHGIELSYEERSRLNESIYAQCEYQHRVRKLIQQSEGQIGQDQLTDWLTRPSIGGAAWARQSLVPSIAAELSVFDIAAIAPEAQRVAFSTVEEDLHKGVDLYMWLQNGERYGIDAKARHKLEVPEVETREDGVIEMRLPTTKLVDFKLHPYQRMDALRKLRAELVNQG